jgi:hypothetical protein
VNDHPFLMETHSRSKRQAVFEDDGVVAFLYLSEPGSTRIVADAWVYNRTTAEGSGRTEHYRPNPPPAEEGATDTTAYVSNPDRYAWSLRWASDGHSVAVCADGIALAFIRAGLKPGFSRNLFTATPWGEPWSEEIYAATFSDA